METKEKSIEKENIREYEEFNYDELSEDEKLLLKGYLNIIEENKKEALSDAHTHLSSGLFEILEENKLYVIVNGSTPQECEIIKKEYRKQSKIISSFGIHPWNSDSISIKEMEEYLDDCDIIGEIGMDNVWCSVDLKVQEEVFRKQLDIAEKRKVPVILHTKGREKEIFEIIKDYDLKILVHWYSEKEYLNSYIEKGCYFSVGPDFEYNEAVAEVVKNVSIDKLLIETDGIDAVKWALNKEVTIHDICGILNNALDYIALKKNIDKKDVRKIINKNFREFIKSSDIRRNY